VSEPFPGFAYAVEITLDGGPPLCRAAFASCEGLQLQRSVLALREGGAPGVARLLAGAESAGNVTLRRGMTEGLDLWGWWERVRAEPALRAQCDIVVLSPDHATEQVRFRLHRCLPVRLAGPDLHAQVSAVALESLELACERVEVLRPGAQPAPEPEREVPVELRELDGRLGREVNEARWVRAQLNPTTLRRTIDPQQSRLELSLLFDVRATTGHRPLTDVRELTEQVAYFAVPQQDGDGEAARPGVRVVWADLVFDGLVAAYDEVLEDFSAHGHAQRAQVSLVVVRETRATVRERGSPGGSAR
jgi:phage tail-like protein